MVRWAAWKRVAISFHAVERARRALLAALLALAGCSLQAPSEEKVFSPSTDLDAGMRDGGRAGMDAAVPFDPARGLLLYYRFNESAGTVVHDFAGTWDGLVYGEPHWVSNGRIEGALQLTGGFPSDAGAGNYVELPPSVLSTLDECTIATWFNWAGMNSWERVFDFGNHLPVWIYFTPSDATGEAHLAGRLPDPRGVFIELTVAQPVRTNTWTHLAVAWSARRVQLFLDGKLMAEGAPEGGVMAKDLGNTQRNWIGRSQFQPGEHPQGFVDPDFAGMIDDFRIYGRALSAGEIAQLYALE
ncbi:MAG TPA: LamG domain-containing protein [Polyangiaceae bacterium]|nr:LamG domain-containing protein [Polyangiaceae bacterium]